MDSWKEIVKTMAVLPEINEPSVMHVSALPIEHILPFSVLHTSLVSLLYTMLFLHSIPCLFPFV
jgi:hypothetical protein